MIDNRVLEYLLENQEIDVAVGDMARELGISRPKAYAAIGTFLDKVYIIKSRIVGRTRLYKLNKRSPRVQLFLSDFKECLKIQLGEKKYSGERKMLRTSAKSV